MAARRRCIGALAGLLMACGGGGSGAPVDASLEGNAGPDGGGSPEAAVDAPGADVTGPEAAPPDGSPADAWSESGLDATTSPCPAGSALVVDATTCSGAVVATPAAWVSSLGSAARGQIATLDVATLAAAPCLPVAVCRPATAPSLLFSDSPETPSTDGVLYADTVGPGTFRLYVYEANGGTAARKFPIVVLNQGVADAHVVLARRGLGGAPATDYVAVGKAAALAWLGSTGAGTVTVPPSARVLLDPALDALHAGAAQLVHAIYDVTLDAPVKISFVSVAAGEDAAALAASLPLLPKDPNHDRGTFAGADRWLVPPGPLDAAGVRKLGLGAAPLDPPLTGTDATTGLPATLGGNYGVVYRVQATLTGNAAVVAFARGGDWGGAASVPPGRDGATSPVALPAAASSLPAGTQAAVLGRFAPGPLDLELLSAGGSSLPVDLTVAPLP